MIRFPAGIRSWLHIQELPGTQKRHFFQKNVRSKLYIQTQKCQSGVSTLRVMLALDEINDGDMQCLWQITFRGQA